MTTPQSSRNKVRTRPTALLALIVAAVQLAGCTAIGPRTVDRDRFDYVSAISESWKRQTLLNLVKTRYQDAPVFMEVASVINQYSLEGQINLEFEWARANTQTLGGEATYTDRPTISYAPLTGEKFARSLMRPIPVGTILLLVQAGYPVDYVLRICAQGINGLHNRSSGEFAGRQADRDFYEVLSLLRQTQMRDGMRMRARALDGQEIVVIQFRATDNEAEAQALKKILQLLGLKADVREFRVVFGNVAESDAEIAILSRSMIQVMSEYASYIEVPETDVAEGRVHATQRESAELEARFPALIRVHCGESKPADAFVTVPYRHQWFWIDDRDIYSKSTFYFLMVMFSFAERGETGQSAPILTVPTN